MIDEEKYHKILNLVKEGLGIKEALISVDMCSMYFYNNASLEQKKAIQFEKATHAHYPSPLMGIKDVKIYHELDEYFRL